MECLWFHRGCLMRICLPLAAMQPGPPRPMHRRMAALLEMDRRRFRPTRVVPFPCHRAEDSVRLGHLSENLHKVAILAQCGAVSVDTFTKAMAARPLLRSVLAVPRERPVCCMAPSTRPYARRFPYLEGSLILRFCKRVLPMQ